MIKVKGLTKTFDYYTKDRKILKNIDFDVKKGELVTIMGPSGGGKSTFLYILALMLKPSAGEVCFNGKKVDYSEDKWLDQYRKKRIGLIFQRPVLVSALNPVENLIIAMHTDKSRRQKIRSAEKLLREAGLKGRERSEISSLSREEVQKVSVARALVNYPEMIFCDEPTGYLDTRGSKSVMDILLSFRENNNSTLVIATHDINIARLGDRKYYMEDGELNEIY